MKSFVFDIDVVGACNLRCPSCPQGNLGSYRLPQGRMEPQLLGRILDKALAECSLQHVNLFSWCEPLLHPGIVDLVRLVQDRGIDCHLSSNLNLLPDADLLMAANPAYFKISVSGFTQELYGFTHRGGDIERVKQHMVRLAQARKRQKASTQVVVNYHRYRHNLKDEPLMRRFAGELGFRFEPAWALLLPLEKMLACPEQGDAGAALSAEDRQLVDHLGLPFRRALEAAATAREPRCGLREDQVSMDCRGNVQLCCGTFVSERYGVANFLELPLAEIQALRDGHPMCRRCMERGAHVYLTYRTPDMERLILETVAPEDALLLDLRGEFARQRRQARLRRLCRPLTALVSRQQRAAVALQVKRVLRLAHRFHTKPDRRTPGAGDD